MLNYLYYLLTLIAIVGPIYLVANRKRECYAARIKKSKYVCVVNLIILCFACFPQSPTPITPRFICIAVSFLSFFGTLVYRSINK